MKSSSESLKSGIVINRMFVGDYLTTNLGHEIINLFRADNDNHYLYLNAYGNFGKEHSGKIVAMLMVRSVGGNAVEVIGMAKDIKPAPGVGQPYTHYQKDPDNRIYKEQIGLIEKDKITYGGVRLDEIFNDAEQQTIFITYWAEPGKVFVPKDKKRIFIQYGKNDKVSLNLSPDDLCVVLEGYNFPSTSLKSYIYPEGDGKGENNEEQQKDYEKVLTEIIDNTELWTADRDWKVNVNKDQIERKPNLFEICQIQNDENRLSNALAYFMMQPENKKLWKDFFQSLGVTLSDGFSVEREVDAKIVGSKEGGGRIDLLIRDKDSIIVIENKIKSGINRKSSDLEGKTQLDRYVNFIESITSESKTNTESQQLKPYYFILTPDYNVPDPSRLNDKFKVVTYKYLYDFLSDENYKEFVERDSNFRAFRETLRRHTLPTPNAYLFDEMLEKFKRRIKEKRIPK